MSIQALNRQINRLSHERDLIHNDIKNLNRDLNSEKINLLKLEKMVAQSSQNLVLNYNYFISNEKSSIVIKLFKESAPTAKSSRFGSEARFVTSSFNLIENFCNFC